MELVGEHFPETILLDTLGRYKMIEDVFIPKSGRLHRGCIGSKVCRNHGCSEWFFPFGVASNKQKLIRDIAF